MLLSSYYLNYGRHLARLRRRRRRRGRAYAPTSNTASHDNHEKIHSWVSFSFPYEYGAPLGVSGRRSSTKTKQAPVPGHMLDMRAHSGINMPRVHEFPHHCFSPNFALKQGIQQYFNSLFTDTF